jgi:hypothetical protein
MKFYNTVSKFITLQDGSRVDGNFDNFIKNHAKSRYDFLNGEAIYQCEQILGDEFLDLLGNKATIKACNIFKFMVKRLELPYLMYDLPTRRGDFFELMPTMPTLPSMVIDQLFMEDDLPF